MKKKCIKIWLVVYRIKNLCYNVYVNKRRGDDILETLQEKLNRLVNESVKELKEIGLGDNLNTNMTFKIKNILNQIKYYCTSSILHL